ncbi:UPF0606 protein KIAA1549L isoform X3 [Triplophysa dalaica]|uniref:UPF0606 protein KIAA1549L isoform X3 n=1 Tax=Triplophysa dalaica TaxID=1582913 RepID=UPI0024E02AD8|nr:UPF0606 protein KIAA1549L isoform X3 [Triplophysa dalaica]
MAGRVEGSWRCSRSGEKRRRCSWRHASGGMSATKLSSLGILLLLIHSAQPSEDDKSRESSGSAVSFLDVATSPSFLTKDESPLSAVHTNSTGLSKGNREQPAFSSILNLLAGTDQMLTKHQLPKVSHENPVISNNETHQLLSNISLERIESSSSELVSNHTSLSESELMSLLVTPRSADPHVKGNDSFIYSPEQRIKDFPKRASVADVDTQQERPEVPVSQPSAFTSNTFTPASTSFPTTTELTSTTGSTSAKRNTKTSNRNSTSLYESTRTKHRILSTSQSTKTTPARYTAGPPKAPVTDTTPLGCNITDRMWIKTVLSIQLRRSRLDSILKQNLPRGLTNALKKALNDSMVQAKVESISSVPNVTVGYYVTHGGMVYTASVVVEALNLYGFERLMADIRQFVPLVQAVPMPAARWRPSPAITHMLKTVLRFVGPDDDLRSCRFTQMMEQRLENAFAEAEAMVLNSYSSLTVQILSASQSSGTPAVSLIYVVYNGSVTLNGTTASNLLSRLTAELVGYFLFYPPLITAEPLEYHNLNISVETRPFWVITVIQDVENSSLEVHYQSFASLMEERLAELLMLAHQQGIRFRRATTVDSYTVQMVSIRRLQGPKNPAEMTYYVQQNGTPLLGTATAKLLNTLDSQTMALTLGYFVELQAEAVVKNPPNNLWIIAAVLAPIGVVTLIIIIITTVLCHKNKNDFKSDPIGSFNPRVKPVQGFDYAKQHLGQQGGDEENLQVTQETMILPHPIRDAPLSLDKVIRRDGSASKKSLASEIRKSRLPSEDGSVISSESRKEVSGKGSIVQKETAQQKLTKEKSRKNNVADHYDSSSGSLQLISIKPMTAPPNYSHPASSDRSQDSAIFNGEVNLALKQKSDIEHYRNKLRLKAKKKGYYDFPSAEGRNSSKDLSKRHKYNRDRPPHPHGRPAEQEDDRGSTYVKHHSRVSQVKQPSQHSRQSLNCPSPGGTEMDLLVMRERPRKGIRNTGYDTEPEIIAETDVDHVESGHYYGCGLQMKGQSETSTLSSQPSIDEVRQQMHLLLEEAFSLASASRTASSRHHQHPPLGSYGLGPVIPYSEVVTSAPGTTCRGQGDLQWVPAYRPDSYQYSLAKQAFRFTQLPDMALGSPPPPIPPRTGPPPEHSLRWSSSELGSRGHCSRSSAPNQHSSAAYMPDSRAAIPPVTTELIPNHSGNPMTAVYAIPASRPGYTGYFISTPPSSYHSPSWMSYPPEPEDVPPQWAESMPLPGYAEAFPHPHYPQGSPLLWHHSQAVSTRGGPDHPPSSSTAASQQSLAESGDRIRPDAPLSSLSTSALVKAIRDEVAKLAKKQAHMFEFQV